MGTADHDPLCSQTTYTTPPWDCLDCELINSVRQQNEKFHEGCICNIENAAHWIDGELQSVWLGEVEFVPSTGEFNKGFEVALRLVERDITNALTSLLQVDLEDEQEKTIVHEYALFLKKHLSEKISDLRKDMDDE